MMHVLATNDMSQTSIISVNDSSEDDQEYLTPRAETTFHSIDEISKDRTR